VILRAFSRLRFRLQILLLLLLFTAFAVVIAVLCQTPTQVSLGWLGLTFIVVGLAWVFANRVDRPLDELARQARAVAAGEPFQASPDQVANREIRELVSAFNEMEKQIRERRIADEKFRMLFEHSSHPHLILDDQGIVDCNRAAIELLGCTAKDEVLALHPSALSPQIQPDGRLSMDKGREMDALARSNGIHRFDWIHMKRNGEIFPAEVTLTPLHLGEREVLLAVWNDLTERMKAEDTLRRSEEKFRRLVEGFRSEYFFYTHNEKGIFVYVSPSVRQVLGYAQEEFLKHYTEYMTDTPRNQQAVFKTELALIGIPQPAYEVEIMHKDGGLRIIEVCEVPVLDASANVIAVEGIAHDVTAGRRAQEELLQAREAAEAASRAKSQFLANMSHELRTPLNVILGYAEMLADEAREKKLPEFADDLQHIKSSGRHLLELINDVLDLSKIEAGRIQVFAESFDVASLVREVGNQIGPIAEKNKNRIEIIAPEDLGMMHTDVIKLRQTLFNLLGNACKFTENGTVTLEAWREAHAQGDWILFRVTDTGIGIAPGVMPQLFQPFVQADASTTRKFGGTGLGLAISRHFCRMMGGDLSASSTLGKGSIFTVRLPAHIHPPDQEPVSVAEEVAS